MSDQETQLHESITIIRQETQLMKRSLETKGKLMDALKHASNLLTELRTSVLTPKQYYELYIMVYDSLSLLATYLKENHPHHHLADLYELVQYAGNIVPRLYLMITVGTVYMSIPEAPVKEIMKDMIEMCRGVQFPIRGLFLRYYLSQTTKSLLPENNDSIQFIITNFIEMNKLWVRLQHQGPLKDRVKRNQERDELKILVGNNLVRLSQLTNDQVYYKDHILPTILEQIVQCKDVLAQEYLLDVIIQVFPDEFHLFTLDEYLNIIKNLNPNVCIKKVLITLIDRLNDFAKRDDYKSTDINLFEKFWFYIQELDQSRNLSILEINSLLESILKLSLTYYPKKFEYIDIILKFAIDKFNELSPSNDESFKSLLLTPINYKNLLSFIKLDNYLKLFQIESIKIQKFISLQILDKFLNNGNKIKNTENIDIIWKILKVLIESKEDDNDFEQVQEKLAKFINLIGNNKDLKTHESQLNISKNYLSKGHIKFTYPSLFFNSLKLIKKSENKIQIFKFISRIINDLSRIDQFETSFKLNLSSAIIADQFNFEDISYEFFVQCFTIYEESISDSKLQFQSLISIINALQQSRNLTRENYDLLITKTALHGSKLLKKPDQCRSVYLASHLWWGVEIPTLGEEEGLTEFYRDPKRVLECLQRSLRVADACMDSSVSIELFIEILNRCLYYFIHGCESITIKYINGLIELIQTNLTEENETPKKHFERTLRYVDSQREIDERFQQITW